MKSDLPRRKPLPQGSLIFQPTKSLVNNQSTIITKSCTISSPILTSNFCLPTTPTTVPKNMQGHTTISTNSSPSSPFTSRRTPSNSTFSTFTSSNNGFTYRQNSQELTRSASSRSSIVPRNIGYVSLMRKQKATVWCDRAQYEDSRLLAQQKAAKIRASFEVTGIQAPHRVSTSGTGNLSSSNRVAAKIRNHGKASLVGYNPGDLIGGVPMRLSATEVEGGDSNDENDNLKSRNSMGHNRSHSGRSSTCSNRLSPSYPRRLTAGSMSRNWSYTSAQKPAEQQVAKNGSSTKSRNSNLDSIPRDAYTSLGIDENSECAGEKADSLTELYTTSPSKLSHRNLLKSSALTRNQSLKSIDQLRRRGSVDDRAATKSTVRLYIANPDVDSD